MKRARISQSILTAMAVATTAQPAAAQLLATAEPADSVASFTGAGLDSLWPSFIQLAGALVFVLVLIWGTTWLARRLLKGRWSPGGGARMQVLERLHLAPKKSVEIVSVGNRVLVLGITESQIGLLTELSPADLAAASAAKPGQAPGLSTGRQRALMNEARHRLNELFRTARPAEVETAPSR